MVLLLINKNYEKTTFVLFIFYILLVLIIVYFISLFYFKIDRYSIINGIVYTDELVLIVVDEKERNIIYNNSTVYIDNKKYKYSINEDRGITIINNGICYYEILIKIDINNKYKINDTLDISIKNKREKVINIFKIIWEDD